MKKILSALHQKIIVVLLGMIGFSVGCIRAEYGVPTADFILNGEVKSRTTELPITGIQITMRHDTVFTNQNGAYDITIYDFPTEQTYNVRFEDIDGQTNGSFESKDTSITFSGDNFSGGDGWYEGETHKTLTVFLDETPE
ncbi:MAG: radical SAM-associated putative lipoprotein [Bacteroidota bacterium]|nr:radical SAM-associated putative lipoprotein [Bacteroidota bacterium]